MFQPFPFHFEGGGRGSEYSGKIDCVFPESGGGRVRRGGKKSYQNSGKNKLPRLLGGGINPVGGGSIPVAGGTTPAKRRDHVY